MISITAPAQSQSAAISLNDAFVSATGGLILHSPTCYASPFHLRSRVKSRRLAEHDGLYPPA
jgi:hypothetical protein